MKRRKPGKKIYKPAGLPKPEIDPEVADVADQISRMTPKELSDKSWISRSAAYNLLNGKTKRPQNLTISGLLYAAGYRRKIVKLK